MLQGKSDRSQPKSHVSSLALRSRGPRPLGVREFPDSQTKRERPQSYSGEGLGSTNNERADKWILSRISLSKNPEYQQANFHLVQTRTHPDF